jgi:hypothetical protein
MSGATGTTRDATALDGEVAHLREQARALHTARATATGESDSHWGGLRDDAARDADAARHASERAAAQAVEQHEASRGYMINVKALETAASEATASGDHARASELREDALAQRALAVAADQRAARAHQAAMDQSARADRLEDDVRDYDKRLTGTGDEGTPAIERLADQLDDKANLLSQAADAQRAAAGFQAQGNAEAAAHANEAASSALATADAIEPAYTAVDAAVLYAAGVTLAGHDDGMFAPVVGDDDAPDADDAPGTDDLPAIDPTGTLDPFDEQSDASTTDGTTLLASDGTDASDPFDGTDDLHVDAISGADHAFHGADDLDVFDDGDPHPFDDPFPADDDASFGPADEPFAAVAADDTAFDFD